MRRLTEAEREDIIDRVYARTESAGPDHLSPREAIEAAVKAVEEALASSGWRDNSVARIWPAGARSISPATPTCCSKSQTNDPRPLQRHVHTTAERNDVSEAYQMVPMYPTKEMILAGEAEMAKDDHYVDVGKIYRAMIAALPPITFNPSGAVK